MMQMYTMNRETQLKITKVAQRIEKAALATKNDRVFNILIVVSDKLSRQGEIFAPKMTEAEMTIVKMYLKD